MKKLFGGINLTWKKVIIAAIILGIYTGIVAMIPIFQDTSFRDISITFEWWVLFGIIIIMNSKSPLDSALKCFVFFLISMPLVYLVQVPFSELGWQMFNFYPDWFKWTILTIPMGYIGHYMKKDKWWGLLILAPMVGFVGYHYYAFLREVYSFFPNHLLSTIFCATTMIIYPLCIFKNKLYKRIGLAISIVIIIVASVYALSSKRDFYNTTILMSGGSLGITFDNTYKAYLDDESYGTLEIVYEKNIEDYMVNASFAKTGTTTFTLESPDGEKIRFNITIERSSYDVSKIEE